MFYEFVLSYLARKGFCVFRILRGNTRRIKGLSKVISIVTLFRTRGTKPHNPLSRACSFAEYKVRKAF